MTYDALFKQLVWKPEVPELPHRGFSGKFTQFIVGGMGGSALPAHAARFLDPNISVSVHGDYDLPGGTTRDQLYIAISYSGETEETISFADAAYAAKLPLVCISSGGALAEFAKRNRVPHILLPKGLPPREALFYLLHGFLAAISRADLSQAIERVSFNATEADTEAVALADAAGAGMPLFYASRVNGFIARGAKVLFNETAKLPAFANVFPELNHNEMQAFDVPGPVADAARFILLRDPKDDPRIARRMDLFARLMKKRGRTVIEVALRGQTRAEELARAWYVCMSAARLSATRRGIVADAVPLIDEFKKNL